MDYAQKGGHEMPTVQTANNIIIDDIDEHEPNAETLEAMREAERPERLKSFLSIEEMLEDFGIDVDC